MVVQFAGDPAALALLGQNQLGHEIAQLRLVAHQVLRALLHAIFQCVVQAAQHAGRMRQLLARQPLAFQQAIALLLALGALNAHRQQVDHGLEQQFFLRRELLALLTGERDGADQRLILHQRQ